MIAKAAKGRGCRGALEYDLREDKGHVIDSNMAGQHPRELAAEFGEIRKLRPNLGKAVLHVSLAELLEPGVYREELWFLGGEDRPIFFFEIEGDTIWGATAAMLRNLLTLVTGTFDPDDRPTPWANRIGT